MTTPAEETKIKLTVNAPSTSEQSSSSGSRSTSAGPQTRSKKGLNPTEIIELELNTLLKFIKPYDGDREKLNSFLINCNNAYDLASDIQKPILFKYILCQLQGKAEIACSIKDFSNWDQLKEFLKTQFSERKHYAHLLTDLQESKQGSQENVGQFALRIETCLSKLLTEISLGDKILVKEAAGRIAAMEDLALHHFLMGLFPRISNIVRCRAPKNLNEAINLAISEERIQQSIYKRPENNPRPRPQNPYSQRSTSQLNSFRGPQRPTYNSNFNQPQQTTSGPSSTFCRYCKIPGHDISGCKKREYNNNRFRFSQNATTNQGSYRPPRVNFVSENVGVDVVDSLSYDEEAPPQIDDNTLNE